MRPHPLDEIERRPTKPVQWIDLKRPTQPGFTVREWRERQRKDSERLVWLAIQWALGLTVLGWLVWAVGL